MSSFLVLCEGDTRNRWRDGQVCPDVDKELWRLGPDGSGVFWREGGDRGGENGRKESGENGRGGEGREREKTGEKEKRKGLSPKIGVKKRMYAGGVEYGI
ncbi:hypothetical protein TNCV_3648381 [Trichonephila clavipes]|nr:hypothetical protein TNCV_3648381 [Trichonephila clavipes]